MTLLSAEQVGVGDACTQSSGGRASRLHYPHRYLPYHFQEKKKKRRATDYLVTKLGSIAWNTETGLWNEPDWFSRLIIGSAIFGAFPLSDATLNLAPVDWVAKAVAVIASQPRAVGQTYHLVASSEIKWTRTSHLSYFARRSIGRVKRSEYWTHAAKVLHLSESEQSCWRPWRRTFPPHVTPSASG
jgi:thioester reductase-like protein